MGAAVEAEARVLALRPSCRTSRTRAAGPAAAPRGCPSRTAPAARAPRPARGRGRRRRPSRRSARSARRSSGPEHARRRGRRRPRGRRRGSRPRSSSPAAARCPPKRVRCSAQASSAGEQVEAGDAAPRAAALALAVERDHDRRPVVALDQPRGDDPDHARDASPRRRRRAPAPRAARSGSSRRAASAAASTSRSVARRSPLARLSSAAICRGPRLVLGQEQLDPGVGPVEPPGGVDPRRQPERQIALVEPARLAFRGLEQRPHPRPLRRAGPPPARAAPATGSRPPAAPRRRPSPAPPDRGRASASGTGSPELRASSGDLPDAPQRARQLPSDRRPAELGERVAARARDAGSGSRAARSPGWWWSVTITSIPSSLRQRAPPRRR